MPFVNEEIPVADIDKYEIEAIDKKFIVGGTHARGWTVDRQRDIYLRCVANGREEYARQSTWTFYWRGELLVAKLSIIDLRGRRGEPGWAHYKLLDNFIPDHLLSRRAEIISDLKEALLAYKDGGIFSTAPSYSITLDEK